MPPKKTDTKTHTVQASFDDFNLREELRKAIKDNAFERPSDV